MQEQHEILATALAPARRTFFKNLGKIGLGATVLANLPQAKGQSTDASKDQANQIFTAALVAEDLATTFYYNGLVGMVIQDPALAGPGGTALAPSSSGNVPNVDYLRAAMTQEIQHANLLRAVGNIGVDATADPFQTFYFPAGTFNTLAPFIATLETLENAFIGAYLNAIREFSALAVLAAGVPDGPYGGPYSSAQLEYFAQVSASILGIECEHRVLGGVILNENQPNNLNFEQTDGLLSVYNGTNSAVAALTPFLTPSTGPGYPLSMALSGAGMLGLASTGNPPAFTPASITASPNPIPVSTGTADATTTITWNAPGVQSIEIHIGSPSGPLFVAGANAGSAKTAAWVSDGLGFYLQDVSGGKALTASNTLAMVVVHLQPM